MIQNIPTKPYDLERSTLTPIEERCVAYYVLFENVGVTRSEAYKAFILPMEMNSKGLLKPPPTKIALGNHAKAWFMRKDVAAFELAYIETMDVFLSGREAKVKVSKKVREQSIKDLIIEPLYNAMSGEKLTMKQLGEITDVSAKLGLFKEETIKVIPPIRYSPISCNECLYKSTIVGLVSKGKCEDECLRCKYKIECNKTGVEYTTETQLKI